MPRRPIPMSPFSAPSAWLAGLPPPPLSQEHRFLPSARLNPPTHTPQPWLRKSPALPF